MANVDPDEAVKLFPELEKRMSVRGGLLSGGEQQMLTLARALARNPRLLLADELSLGLAPLVVDRLLQAVRQYAKEKGTAVLIVEQHAHKALQYADRAIVMRRGRVELSLSGEEARKRIGEVEQAYLTGGQAGHAGHHPDRRERDRPTAAGVGQHALRRRARRPRGCAVGDRSVRFAACPGFGLSAQRRPWSWRLVWGWRRRRRATWTCRTGRARASRGPTSAAARTGNAVAIQPDGKIVVAGTSTNAAGTQAFFVARFLNPQGALDPSYGLGTGASRPNFGTQESGAALALQPDGKILVAGSSSSSPAGSHMFVERLLNPEGTVDFSYGLGTGASRPNFDQTEFATAIALQPDGKIVVAGTSIDGTPRSRILVVRLLNPQGTLDPSYGLGTGGSRPDLPGSVFTSAVAIQQDGKILAAGTEEPGGFNTPGNFVVARFLNPQGTSDTELRLRRQRCHRLRQ